MISILLAAALVCAPTVIIKEGQPITKENLSPHDRRVLRGAQISCGFKKSPCVEHFEVRDFQSYYIICKDYTEKEI